MRVGLAQFKPTKANVAANLDRIREIVHGRVGDADVLLFPEASLSGYFLEGGVAEAAQTAEEVAVGLGEATDGAPDVVLGFYERHQRSLFNSVAYFGAVDGCYRLVHIHRKVFLPTYGVFDEARFLEHGREVRAFDTRFGRMGMLICEEMWHSLPATILALGGAEVVLVASASPARDFSPGTEGMPKNLQRWDSIAPAVAQEHGVFVVVAQLFGSEGGKIFAGGSLAVGPGGSVIGRGPLLEEDVTVVGLDRSAIDRARVEAPLLADLERALPDLQRGLEEARSRRRAEPKDLAGPPGAHREAAQVRPSLPGLDPDDTSMLDLDLELVERVLVEFIREEVVRHRGFERVVIGLSGGVDSSVAAYLAVRALGPENVYCFQLPYATSSSESLEHAGLVLEETGAHGRIIAITGAVDAYVETHEPDLSPLRRGNLSARVRSVILFDQSARLDALPLGTGNKSERLLGYYTWHADDSPPINPLGDLFKGQVWALARHLGVPDVIVNKPASADLVRGIHDEDELGISYHRADPILHWLLKGYTAEGLKEYGFPEGEVDLVWKRLSSTHWKRELPTVAMLSSSAIGQFYLRPVDY
jgi:NAD+ synthase (glutamine-hydrolysing)